MVKVKPLSISVPLKWHCRERRLIRNCTVYILDIGFSYENNTEQGSLKDSYTPTPTPQNYNGAASKFKAQTGGLQLWPWLWVCIVELRILHIISLRWTFDPNLINIFQRVQEIWSEHEIQGSNSWPVTVTLTLSRHAWIMGSAHRLTKANIWPKFHENLSKGSGDMERTRKRRITFNCDLDLESASSSYRFYTSSH